MVNKTTLSEAKTKLWLQELDFFVSVILLAVFSYFIVGVFSLYAMSVFAFLGILLAIHYQGVKSLATFGAVSFFIVSTVFINAHHYMHSLVMMVMLLLFLLNRKVKNLWWQNAIIITLFLCLILKPGLYLIVFSNYDRLLLAIYAMLTGGSV